MVISASDPRGPKAVALATDAGQWIRCRDRLDGRKVYGIPSSEPGRYYFTGRNFCTCPARMHRPGEDCKHMLAVQLHCELVREQENSDKYEDIFTRFEQDDRPVPTADLSRILGKPRRYQSGPFKGVVISERED